MRKRHFVSFFTIVSLFLSTVHAEDANGRFAIKLVDQSEISGHKKDVRVFYDHLARKDSARFKLQHQRDSSFSLKSLSGDNFHIDSVTFAFTSGPDDSVIPVVYLTSHQMIETMNRDFISQDSVDFGFDDKVDSAKAMPMRLRYSADRPTISFSIDAKPVDNNGVAAKLDYKWRYQSGGFGTWQLSGTSTGTLSSQSKDSLNSMIFGLGVLKDVGGTHYVPFELSIQSQNTQDFYVKDVGIEPTLSFPTRLLGDWIRPSLWVHYIFGDVNQAAPDPFLTIGVFLGDRLAPKGDTTKGIIRLEGNTDWQFPLIGKNYATVTLKGWFVPTSKSKKTYSYVAIAYSQEISDTFAWTVKWINGSLPPLFDRTVTFNIGFTVKSK